MAWYSANLDPWENPGSLLYGAALAAMAVGTTPPDSRRAAPASKQTATLTSYLARSTTPERPLHDRLAVLWASSKLPEVLPEAVRTALVAETFAKQSADGGWSINSIGPWALHAAAPPTAGSSTYATGFVAFALQRSGIPSSNPRLVRALGWLRSQQQPDTGAWAAVSMSKRYPPGSMEALFMQDAATAFASMALLEGGR